MQSSREICRLGGTIASRGEIRTVNRSVLVVRWREECWCVALKASGAVTLVELSITVNRACVTVCSRLCIRGARANPEPSCWNVARVSVEGWFHWCVSGINSIRDRWEAPPADLGSIQTGMPDFVRPDLHDTHSARPRESEEDGVGDVKMLLPRRDETERSLVWLHAGVSPLRLGSNHDGRPTAGRRRSVHSQHQGRLFLTSHTRLHLLHLTLDSHLSLAGSMPDGLPHPARYRSRHLTQAHRAARLITLGGMAVSTASTETRPECVRQHGPVQRSSRCGTWTAIEVEVRKIDKRPLDHVSRT